MQCLHDGVNACIVHMRLGSRGGCCLPSFEGPCPVPPHAPPSQFLDGGCAQKNFQTIVSLVHVGARGHLDPQVLHFPGKPLLARCYSNLDPALYVNVWTARPIRLARRPLPWRRRCRSVQPPQPLVPFHGCWQREPQTHILRQMQRQTRQEEQEGEQREEGEPKEVPGW